MGGRGRTTEDKQRLADVLRMRLSGVREVDIAEKYGISQPRVSQLYRQALSQVPLDEAADALRAEQAERLDALLVEVNATLPRAREVLGTKHLVTNNRGVVMWGGEPLVDDGPTLAAIDRILAAARTIVTIEDRRAKLLGLDAEKKVSVDEKLTYEIVGVDLDRL